MRPRKLKDILRTIKQALMLVVEKKDTSSHLHYDANVTF